MTKYDEPKVKAAVEEAAVLDLWPDRTLLEVAEIEVGDCRSHIAEFAPVCWHLIDGLGIDRLIIQSNQIGADNAHHATASFQDANARRRKNR